MEMDPELKLVEAKEESVIAHFLSSALFSELQQYAYLKEHYTEKEEELTKRTFHLNFSFLILGVFSMISSIEHAPLALVSLFMTPLFLVNAYKPESFLRRMSKNKHMHQIWSFMNRPIWNRKNAAELMFEEKGQHIQGLLDKNENKMLMANLYQYFSEYYDQTTIKNQLVKVLLSYKENDMEKVLSELLESFSELEKNLIAQNKVDNADIIAKDIIEEVNQSEEKKRQIFKRKELYKV